LAYHGLKSVGLYDPTRPAKHWNKHAWNRRNL